MSGRKNLQVALAGNPNVGKSTVFNALTGLHQHTGNWPGKTVEHARGVCRYRGQEMDLIDLPGCYSLTAHSVEEEAARDFLCLEPCDVVVVVCDASCLERNLNLAIQILELTSSVILCVNLMDEARKKGIEVDLAALERLLGIPVVQTEARNHIGLDHLCEKICQMGAAERADCKAQSLESKCMCGIVEEAVQSLQQRLVGSMRESKGIRWLILRMLEGDQACEAAIRRHGLEQVCAFESTHRSMSTPAYELISVEQEWDMACKEVFMQLREQGIRPEGLADETIARWNARSHSIGEAVLHYRNRDYNKGDRKRDWLFTSRYTGIPIMFLLLIGIFWLTITGANYPSKLLDAGFHLLGEQMSKGLIWLGTPALLHSMFMDGIYRVLTWVIAVMLPPMAIFFPLFTLLEDYGYLPRVAYNLDRCFQKCNACGKQALCMCQGFGCNAVGVAGCRIIDSKRERLIAIITNSFVPCNGRFPTMVAILTMFFVSESAGFGGTIQAAILLALLILLGIGMTLLVSRILSVTILKGVPSSFTLELPPYRRPQVGKVLVRSMLDRTLFVLGRAAAVAAPAGLLIWLLAGITIQGASLLTYCAQFLDPFARMMGMDGVILLAFVIGIPANEIVVPLILMIYMAEGTLVPADNLILLKEQLLAHGWTWMTAISTLLFSLMHWPCSTTCLTIHKETKSLKWTAVSFLVPTLAGMVICTLFANVAKLFV